MNIRASLAIAVSVFVAAFAQAQALNIDCGGVIGVPPSDSYGAGSAQAGYWNPVGDEADLRDINNMPTAARLGSSSGSQLFEIAGASGGDEALMESVFSIGVGSNLLSLTNLLPGQYDLYAYSWGGHLFGSRTVGFTVRNGIDTYIDSLAFNETWPGQQVLGETFVRIPVEVLEGRNFLTLSMGGGGSKTFNVLAGLQLVPIPAPGAAAVFLAASVLAARRRR